MINGNEISLARHCMAYAMRNGASAIRLSLSKSVIDSCSTLNGEVDKVSHSADRSMYIYVYADGRYGTFSTNRLEKESLEEFIVKAIGMVRMLGEDMHRCLPAPERTADDAATGLEAGLYDHSYDASDTDGRMKKAAGMSIYGSMAANCSGKEARVISEECEYSESCEDTVLMDSNGFEGRHQETVFSCFSETTVEDEDGNKYSGYWWESSPFRTGIDTTGCVRKAHERAVGQIGARRRKSGRYNMVVDTTAAPKLVSPIFSALNAMSLQQKMSFLEDSLGKRIFSEGLTIMDLPRTAGKAGARLFDTEGVATKDAPIIENGIVRQYFVNTYMAGKMGIEATVEDISRPCLMPYLKGQRDVYKGKEVSLDDILKFCGNGVLVTGFNGGNCNPVTGDYSYGIEGFAFSKGKITHPVKEMLITGNIKELWNSLTAAGSDARSSTRWQIPSLAFEGVSFSA